MRWVYVNVVVVYNPNWNEQRNDITETYNMKMEKVFHVSADNNSNTNKIQIGPPMDLCERMATYYVYRRMWICIHTLTHTHSANQLIETEQWTKKKHKIK